MKFFKNCFGKIKTRFHTTCALFKENSLPSQSLSKRRFIFFKIILISLLAIVFLTVLMQAPMFAERNINGLALVLWPLLFVLILIFDYKSFIVGFLKTLLFILPFIIYLLIAFIFGVNAITGQLTRMIFLSAFICVLGQSLAPYISKNNIQLIMVSYIIASVILAILIYFHSLRGSDISSGIYAYEEKNSSAPIIFIAGIMSFYIDDKNKIFINTIRIVINALFIVLIALMKCRTVLITMPFVYFVLFIFKKPSPKVFIVTMFIVLVSIIAVFVIPQVRTIIIEEILFNNKGNQGTDAIFSGRITLIIKALEQLKPILGSGDKYVDCTPVQILCSYGVVGAIALLPFFHMPLYFLIKHKKYNGKTEYYFLYILVLIVFVFNILFEGHGHFGPGAKVFILWVIGGFMDKNYVGNKVDVLSSKTANRIKSNCFIIALSSLSLVFSFIIMCIPKIYQSVSLSAYNRFNSTVETSNYIPIESIEINGPDTMCVGQKIKFDAIVYPENATDKQIFWESWGTSRLSIEGLTGVATAKAAGEINIKAFCYDYMNDSRHGIKVKKQQEFDFSQYNFVISLDNNTDSELMIGQKTKINYDENIFPCKEFISYTTSNDVVTIEDGYIVANKTGNCEIYATITNDYITTSNILSLVVGSKKCAPIDNIELDIGDSVYQNVDYDFNPKFYSNGNLIDNCDYKVDVQGSKYEIHDKKIRFLNSGDSMITITPTNSTSDSFVYLKTFNLQSNLATDLSIKTPDWMVYGEKYKFDVFIIYQNGYSRLAKESEIKPKSLRAGANTSGVCDDYFHYAAIKSGNTSITYDLNGTNIYKKHNFNVYVADKTTYYMNAKNTIFPFITILYLVFIMPTSLVVLKSKRQYFVFCPIILIIGLTPFVISIFMNKLLLNWLFYFIIGIYSILFLLTKCLLTKHHYTGLYANNVILEKRKEISTNFHEVKI